MSAGSGEVMLALEDVSLSYQSRRKSFDHGSR